MGSREVYIDLGANVGETIANFAEKNPEALIYGFEPNPSLAQNLRARFNGDSVLIFEKAAWILDGVKRFYLGHDLSSTLIDGKRSMPDYPEFEISYEKYVLVETIDLSRWLLDTFTENVHITMKIDIEGSEYKLLQRMLDTDAIDLVKTIYCEFHYDRFPAISAETHERIKSQVAQRSDLKVWR
ncbi:FkbM family methyltransferase [Sinorhizobium meliloti]|uniref:FkbM family methyltransferase n=1 Tax=Sinorhizobium TaxID=28105 RepID=UPI000FD91BB4|nr:MULTISPECIES: FkbM family methyltransferase [Sinorhizobium]RVO81090.1 FkbM family methyltransferase [Sinorhizobium meliloti]RVQ09108.1 FkbM family methyltransferase [Sinorhizobium meliloti]WQO87654.1 FkbM family methyltransferase [Sinorhizobium medicae]